MKTALYGCLLVALGCSACRQDMYNQPRTKPYSQSDFFPDGTSARPIPPHAVEYHQPRENEAYYSGLTNDVLVTQLPAPVKLTPQLLKRGQERFDIYCAVCHGLAGDGNGEVVKRGFPTPPSYHTARLRNAPIGHFYDVITNGYGVMYSSASRVEPNDRWAIAAYIRALQLSQRAKASDLPLREQSALNKTP
ncbi:MAG: c-type cytochrome [Bryobacteraceae bacterium]